MLQLIEAGAAQDVKTGEVSVIPSARPFFLEAAFSHTSYATHTLHPANIQHTVQTEHIQHTVQTEHTAPATLFTWRQILFTRRSHCTTHCSYEVCFCDSGQTRIFVVIWRTKQFETKRVASVRRVERVILRLVLCGSGQRCRCAVGQALPISQEHPHSHQAGALPCEQCVNSVNCV